MAAFATSTRPMLAALVLLLLQMMMMPAAAAGSLSIYTNSSTYAYVGCWNETTDLPGTTQTRALDGGINEQQPNVMTVPMCLDFCAKNTSVSYRYAGLEYSRECWCSNKLNVLSVRLNDSACNLPCDGDNSTACGGSLRLSLYNLTDSGSSKGSAATRLAVGAGQSLLLLSTGLWVAGLVAAFGLW